MNRHLTYSFTVCILAVLCEYQARAQERSAAGAFELRGHINGGGGLSSGGEFQVFGRIAEAAAGQSSNGNFALVGGFVEQFTVPLPPGDIFMDIAMIPVGIQISWPREASGFMLETTSILVPGGSWEMVPITDQQTSIVIQPNEQRRFFRMRKR